MRGFRLSESQGHSKSCFVEPLFVAKRRAFRLQRLLERSFLLGVLAQNMLLAREVPSEQAREFPFPSMYPSHDGTLARRPDPPDPGGGTEVAQITSKAILDDSPAQHWPDAWHLSETLVEQVLGQSSVQLRRTLAPQEFQLLL